MLTCSNCGSKEIETDYDTPVIERFSPDNAKINTQKYHVCVTCGHREPVGGTPTGSGTP
jgi:hypothetical protein